MEFVSIMLLYISTRSILCLYLGYKLTTWQASILKAGVLVHHNCQERELHSLESVWKSFIIILTIFFDHVRQVRTSGFFFVHHFSWIGFFTGCGLINFNMQISFGTVLHT